MLPPMDRRGIAQRARNGAGELAEQGRERLGDSRQRGPPGGRLEEGEVDRHGGGEPLDVPLVDKDLANDDVTRAPSAMLSVPW